MPSNKHSQRKYGIVFNIINSLPFPIGVLVSYLVKGDGEINMLTVGLCVAAGYALIGG